MAMDIVDRVRRMRNSLGEVLTNLKTNMSLKSPGEINKEDDLGIEPKPDSEDMFAGISDEEELGGLGGTETPTADLETPTEPETDVDALLGAETPENEEELEEGPKEDQEDMLGKKPEVAEVEKSKERVWEPIDSPDGKSLRFKSDKEGVMLDMKMLNTNPFIWLARLQKDGKLLDWGTVLIPKDIDDPVSYIKYISNAMLDMKSMRYEQEWQKKFAEARKKEEEAKEPKPELPPEPPPEPAAGDEDIGGLLGGAPETPAAPAVAPEEEIDVESLLA